MYLDFYKLKEFPFSITCDGRFFYESTIHAEALANMIYTVQQRKGMVLVTGQVGTGKTFVGNMLGPRLGRGCLTVLMKNPPRSAKQLICAVATRVGMNVHVSADKLSLVEDLEQHLVRMHNRGRLVALVLDEAQDLPPAVLEEIRFLWNWEHDGQKVVQIVLIGQPELRKRLLEAKCEALRQRVVLSYDIGHLPAEDTGAYIDHRITVAADDGCLAEFTCGAKADIHAATDGIPRLINILCDNALLVGYARGVHIIEGSMVSQVLADMTCWGLRDPNQSGASTAPTRAPVDM